MLVFIRSLVCRMCCNFSQTKLDLCIYGWGSSSWSSETCLSCCKLQTSHRYFRSFIEAHRHQSTWYCTSTLFLVFYYYLLDQNVLPFGYSLIGVPLSTTLFYFVLFLNATIHCGWNHPVMAVCISWWRTELHRCLQEHLFPWGVRRTLAAMATDAKNTPRNGREGGSQGNCDTIAEILQLVGYVIGFTN